MRVWNGKKIVDAGYDAMVRAIREDRTPNLLLLHYADDWFVRDLLLIPRWFLIENVIEKRRPLGPSARRAGWVGCNILLQQIPPDGKIPMVATGAPLPSHNVRRQYSRAKRLSHLAPDQRGWTVEVLNLLRRLNKTAFHLHEVYDFDSELQSAHPNNRNIRPKIRQQLQILRDLGIVEFTGRGTYAFR